MMRESRSRLAAIGKALRFAVLCLLASALLPSLSQTQGPVFKVSTEESDIRFFVKASVAIEGKFNKWDASLTLPSADATSGVLDIKFMRTPWIREAA
jgi:hypothetical protein